MFERQEVWRIWGQVVGVNGDDSHYPATVRKNNNALLREQLFYNAFINRR